MGNNPATECTRQTFFEMITDPENMIVSQIFRLRDITDIQRIRIEKTVSIFTIKDPGIADPCTDACFLIQCSGSEHCIQRRFGDEARSHKLVWASLWHMFDTQITPSDTYDPQIDHSKWSIMLHEPRMQLLLRVYTFHLLSTLSPNSIGRDVSVPARGLHGEAYRGHIFWDEVFILPFFTLRLSEASKTCLLYRYHRLNKARANAREQGFSGALFPWQSGSNGREETQEVHLNPLSGRWDPDLSRLQRHVNIAIAYSIIRYYDATRDVSFIERWGMEMVLEICRFWASTCTQVVSDGRVVRYEINCVMGPDEFHEKYPDWLAEQYPTQNQTALHRMQQFEGAGLNNNAYTNVMVVWLLRRTLELFDNCISHNVRHNLKARLDLHTHEIQLWNDIASKMTVPFFSDPSRPISYTSHTTEEALVMTRPSMIISQFAGYEKLKELDWDKLGQYGSNIGRVDRILRAEGKSPDDYKVSKQPDVCMLFYLLTAREVVTIIRDSLGYDFQMEDIVPNIEFYLNRTSHGSTISRLVFASIVYQYIDRKQGWDFYLDSLRSDIDDVQGGTTREGVHLVPMAGASEFCTRIFAGLDISRGALSFNPKLPPSIKQIRFHLEHHSETFEIAITHEHVRISRSEFSQGDGPRSPSLPVFVEGFMRILDPKSESLVIELKEKRLGNPLQCNVCGTGLDRDCHFTCRRCGQVFCAKHFVAEPKWAMLPSQFNLDPVRVCNECFTSAMQHNFEEPSDWWNDIDRLEGEI